MTKPQTHTTCKNCGRKFRKEFKQQRYCDLECRLEYSTTFASDDECWTWGGSTNQFGYGDFRYNGKYYRVHRLAYELRNGEIPEGMFVCHTCDNPRCTNPSHLFLGTSTDNIMDMAAKGRHGAAKLSRDDIPKIRKLIDENISQDKIADMFSVSQSVISSIKIGETWVHV